MTFRWSLILALALTEGLFVMAAAGVGASVAVVLGWLLASCLEDWMGRT